MEILLFTHALVPDPRPATGPTVLGLYMERTADLDLAAPRSRHAGPCGLQPAWTRGPVT
jgi:hypothetical protein